MDKKQLDRTFPSKVKSEDYVLLEGRLRLEAELKAANRRVAEYGPAGGNPNAKAEDHYEWEAANAIREQRADRDAPVNAQITVDLINANKELANVVTELYGQLAALRAERDAAQVELVNERGRHREFERELLTRAASVDERLRSERDQMLLLYKFAADSCASFSAVVIAERDALKLRLNELQELLATGTVIEGWK